MGYFLRKFGIVLEAEVDGEDQTPPKEANADDTTADTPAEEAPAETADANEETPTTEEEEPDNTDYTAAADDLDSGDEGSEGAGGEDNPDDAGDTGGDTTTDAPVDELKKQEEDIYANANLTPDQLDIRHKKLKEDYLKLYDMTNAVIERIGDASINEENIKVIEYISNKLSELRTMLADYVNNVYRGKSYIENAINFNRFLAVMNGINQMLEKLGKEEDK